MVWLTVLLSSSLLNTLLKNKGGGAKSIFTSDPFGLLSWDVFTRLQKSGVKQLVLVWYIICRKCQMHISNNWYIILTIEVITCMRYENIFEIEMKQLKPVKLHGKKLENVRTIFPLYTSQFIPFLERGFHNLFII